MFDSQIYRKLALTAAVFGFLTAMACSNQPGPVASHASDGGAGSRPAAVKPAGSSADASQASAAQADAAQTNASQANTAQPLHLVTLPKGTEITTIVDQTLASGRNHWG